MSAFGAALVAMTAMACDDGGNGENPITTDRLFVTYAAENEVGRGVVAYAEFRDGAEDGPHVELADDDVVACNGTRLSRQVAVGGAVYYSMQMPDLGEGGSYVFTLTRPGEEAYSSAIELPSEALVDEDATDSEVVIGQDFVAAVGPGAAEELELTIVAPCVDLVTATTEGSDETITVPGEDIVCGCASGGNTPPCDATIRVQRINRGEVDEAFAGGETLGVQRDEVEGVPVSDAE